MEKVTEDYSANLTKEENELAIQIIHGLRRNPEKLKSLQKNPDGFFILRAKQIHQLIKIILNSEKKLGRNKDFKNKAFGNILMHVYKASSEELFQVDFGVEEKNDQEIYSLVYKIREGIGSLRKSKEVKAALAILENNIEEKKETLNSTMQEMQKSGVFDLSGTNSAEEMLESLEKNSAEAFKVTILKKLEKEENKELFKKLKRKQEELIASGSNEDLFLTLAKEFSKKETRAEMVFSELEKAILKGDKVALDKIAEFAKISGSIRNKFVDGKRVRNSDFIFAEQNGTAGGDGSGKFKIFTNGILEFRKKKNVLDFYRKESVNYVFNKIKLELLLSYCYRDKFEELKVRNKLTPAPLEEEERLKGERSELLNFIKNANQKSIEDLNREIIFLSDQRAKRQRDNNFMIDFGSKEEYQKYKNDSVVNHLEDKIFFLEILIIIKNIKKLGKRLEEIGNKILTKKEGEALELEKEEEKIVKEIKLLGLKLRKIRKDLTNKLETNYSIFIRDFKEKVNEVLRNKNYKEEEEKYERIKRNFIENFGGLKEVE